MKYLLILADGLADYKIAELGGKTPLEYAQTPNMDFLARTSIIGKARTIPEGFPPGERCCQFSGNGLQSGNLLYRSFPPGGSEYGYRTGR
jgi:2,3-bisphosphoglycerate-independent phosphoglycerate mutase